MANLGGGFFRVVRQQGGEEIGSGTRGDEEMLVHLEVAQVLRGEGTVCAVDGIHMLALSMNVIT